MDYVVHKIHFEKKYSLQIEDFKDVVKQYGFDYDNSIDLVPVYEVGIRANIIKEISGNGSIAYITEENRQVQNSYRYDAFGNLTESREEIENRILYTGQQYD